MLDIIKFRARRTRFMKKKQNEKLYLSGSKILIYTILM